MRNGFLTSEFFSQLPAYAVAAVLIYLGMGDPETMALIREAVSGLPPSVQALVMLGLKLAGWIGAAYVAGKGAETSKYYVGGRAKLKEKMLDK